MASAPGVLVRQHETGEIQRVATIRAGRTDGPAVAGAEIVLSLFAEERIDAGGVGETVALSVGMWLYGPALLSAVQARRLAAALLNVADQVDTLAAGPLDAAAGLDGMW